tara:strand:- start:1552 stop:2694 length:1143 start_codon:yes stop_codon:yes gene_type:complete
MKILKDILDKKKSTLLGVGPMSLNCVNATIEIANEKDIPLMMIASRRQIDCAYFGGGYVNNWSTEDYSSYVKKNDIKSNIILSRDHGGPYQNNSELENKLPLDQAMDCAKKSFEIDIINDFKIIHIDPSIDPSGELNTEEIISRLKELYIFCIETAKKNNKEIIIEIGTEEQSGGTNTLEELEYSLDSITEFCNQNKLQKPFFVVVQTGTKVMETKNIGIFEEVSKNFEASRIPKLIKLCDKYGIYMKQHNTDYLNDNFLSKHPSFGIHAANVAPEYGVAETKKILEILDHNNLKEIRDKFINLCLQSKKWVKWAIDADKLDDYQKTIICGHYSFSNPVFTQLKKDMAKEIHLDRSELDLILKDSVKKSILRYVKDFNLA